MGIGEFAPNNWLMDAMADLVCAPDDWLPEICADVAFLAMGFDKAQFNMTLMDTIVHHTPAGSSSRTVVQYAQGVNSGNYGLLLQSFGKNSNTANQ